MCFSSMAVLHKLDRFLFNLITKCTDPKKLDRLLNRFIGKEFGIAPDSFRLILV